jgi:hypothetical protein
MAAHTRTLGKGIRIPSILPGRPEGPRIGCGDPHRVSINLRFRPVSYALATSGNCGADDGAPKSAV